MPTFTLEKSTWLRNSGDAPEWMRERRSLDSSKWLGTFRHNSVLYCCAGYQAAIQYGSYNWLFGQDVAYANDKYHETDEMKIADLRIAFAAWGWKFEVTNG